MTAAKILFAGTPDFALQSLLALHKADYVPAAVMTQPDRPAGRGKKVTESPVKQFAREHDIPVWQPETLKEADIVAQIAAAKPDLMIVAAYGLLLPQAVLDIPAHGCVNVHASLLPRWRGAAPIQAAILEGDAVTGVTLMQMESGLDSGPLLASATMVTCWRRILRQSWRAGWRRFRRTMRLPPTPARFARRMRRSTGVSMRRKSRA
jgi:methionyl-tRNA formyltransferase